MAMKVVKQRKPVPKSKPLALPANKGRYPPVPPGMEQGKDKPQSPVSSAPLTPKPQAQPPVRGLPAVLPPAPPTIPGGDALALQEMKRRLPQQLGGADAQVRGLPQPAQIHSSTEDPNYDKASLGIYRGPSGGIYGGPSPLGGGVGNQMAQVNNPFGPGRNFNPGDGAIVDGGPGGGAPQSGDAYNGGRQDLMTPPDDQYPTFGGGLTGFNQPAQNPILKAIMGGPMQPSGLKPPQAPMPTPAPAVDPNQQYQRWLRKQGGQTPPIANIGDQNNVQPAPLQRLPRNPRNGGF